VERFTKADQACTLAAALAHDFNNELTVILSSVSTLIEALEPGHPARPQALDLQDAARRCARKTSGLLRYGLKRGGRAPRTSLERLIDND
jgi:signal transduction histidine kinase